MEEVRSPSLTRLLATLAALLVLVGALVVGVIASSSLRPRPRSVPREPRTAAPAVRSEVSAAGSRDLLSNRWSVLRSRKVPSSSPPEAGTLQSVRAWAVTCVPRSGAFLRQAEADGFAPRAPSDYPERHDWSDKQPTNFEVHRMRTSGLISGSSSAATARAARTSTSAASSTSDGVAELEPERSRKVDVDPAERGPRPPRNADHRLRHSRPSPGSELRPRGRLTLIASACLACSYPVRCQLGEADPRPDLDGDRPRGVGSDAAGCNRHRSLPACMAQPTRFASGGDDGWGHHLRRGCRPRGARRPQDPESLIHQDLDRAFCQRVSSRWAIVDRRSASVAVGHPATPGACTGPDVAQACSGADADDPSRDAPAVRATVGQG